MSNQYKNSFTMISPAVVRHDRDNYVVRQAGRFEFNLRQYDSEGILLYDVSLPCDAGYRGTNRQEKLMSLYYGLIVKQNPSGAPMTPALEDTDRTKMAFGLIALGYTPFIQRAKSEPEREFDPGR